MAFLPVFWALQAGKTAQNLRYGFLYGFITVALLFPWIAETVTLFGDLPAAAGLGILLLFSAAFGTPYVLIWGTVHPLRERLGPWWVAVTPAVAVLTEYGTSFVTLFPYQHGSTFYRVPTLMQITSVTGVWGLTYLIYLVNCGLAEVLYRRRDGTAEFPRWAVAIPLLAVALVLAFGTWRFAHIEAALQEAPTLRMAQIQLETTMVERMRSDGRRTLKKWIAATAEIEPGTADIVVWSEAAYPYYLNEEPDETLSALARNGQFELIVGAGAREPAPGASKDDFHTFNTVYFFDAKGNLVDRYDKIVPVPFGEYIPGAGLFPQLEALIPTEGMFRPGDVATVVEGAHARIASPICYEAIFGRICRRFEEPDLIVNVTNDGWFGDTAAPHQHAMLAVLRATELGVPMFRAAYSGVSMVVEPHGRIVAETVPFTAVNRIVVVRSQTFSTLYGRLGDWFVLFCLGVVGLTGMLSSIRDD